MKKANLLPAAVLGGGLLLSGCEPHSMEKLNQFLESNHVSNACHTDVASYGQEPVSPSDLAVVRDCANVSPTDIATLQSLNWDALKDDHPSTLFYIYAGTAALAMVVGLAAAATEH